MSAIFHTKVTFIKFQIWVLYGDQTLLQDSTKIINYLRRYRNIDFFVQSMRLFAKNFEFFAKIL